MAKRYIKLTFQNSPSTVTPLSATNLNKISTALDECDTEIENKFDKSNIVHTTEVNDTAKVPSSSVTNSLAQSITSLNNNLALKSFGVQNTLLANTTNCPGGFNSIISSIGRNIAVFCDAGLSGLPTADSYTAIIFGYGAINHAMAIGGTGLYVKTFLSDGSYDSGWNVK